MSYSYKRKIDGPGPAMPAPTLPPAQEKAELLRLALLCEEGWRAMARRDLPPMRRASDIQKKPAIRWPKGWPE